jgi:sulfite reductase alpha subunit-like flavoprotein
MNSFQKIVVLYGSQSGTAQDLAERIWRKLKQHETASTILLNSFNKLDMNLLLEPNTLMLCICSTTGQGDVPDNMIKFWRNIMKKGVPANLLLDLNICVVGLGSSSYEKYNFVAKKLYKRLIQLGAKPLIDVCLCDEQANEGIEGTFLKWTQQFFLAIGATQMPKFKSNQINMYKLVYLDSQNTLYKNGSTEINEENPHFARLVKNERVTPETHWQNVRFIEFDCSDTQKLKYEAGDVLVMRPSNTRRNVSKFLELFEHLNLDLSKAIQIETSSNNEVECGPEIYSVRTVKDLIENYFDLNCIPRLSFFQLFKEFADDELEKEKLEEFLSLEGLDDLNTYCYRPRRTTLEIFQDFAKTTRNINTLDALLELIPSIKPRSFSIASSPYVHNSKIQLLVAVVEYKTRLYETRKGTCSYWLSTLDPTREEIRIPIWIKKGSFKLDWSKPLICVGPGTGVAPFRSIINERIKLHGYAQNHLFFGCRNQSSDFFFEHEWTQIEQEHPDHFHIYPAFSRDQQEKIYVQDLMEKHQENLFHLIENLKATVLIAGSSNRMPSDVKAILEKIIRNHFSKQTNIPVNETDLENQSKDYMKKLEAENRIQMETWS